MLRGLAALAACLLAATSISPTALSDETKSSTPTDAPRPIYSDDPKDAWNRIFHALFTRKVRARLSDEFPEGAPFGFVRESFPRVRASARLFERVEVGDRAVEPLYPSFIGAAGPSEVLKEPRYSALVRALEEALRETRPRPPLQRALMQADAWAAFDILLPLAGREPAASGLKQTEARARELLRLLAAFVKKLALTPEEIDALPRNYGPAARAHGLPNLFAREDGWAEVEWLPERLHDDAADYRRAARVFVRPSAAQRDAQAFLDGLRNAHDADERLGAVALVTQDLLVDARGNVVPSPLVRETQFRTFVRAGGAARNDIRQFELSRRLLLAGDARGGLVEVKETEAHYLPSAGNDYSFASPQYGARDLDHPVVVSLRTRCSTCHGARGERVFTFSMHSQGGPVPVKILNPTRDERALYVARRKAERDDFKALKGLWGARRAGP